MISTLHNLRLSQLLAANRARLIASGRDPNAYLPLPHVYASSRTVWEYTNADADDSFRLTSPRRWITLRWYVYLNRQLSTHPSTHFTGTYPEALAHYRAIWPDRPILMFGQFAPDPYDYPRPHEWGRISPPVTNR